MTSRGDNKENGQEQQQQQQQPRQGSSSSGGVTSLEVPKKTKHGNYMLQRSKKVRITSLGGRKTSVPTGVKMVIGDEPQQRHHSPVMTGGGGHMGYNNVDNVADCASVNSNEVIANGTNGMISSPTDYKALVRSITHGTNDNDILRGASPNNLNAVLSNCGSLENLNELRGSNSNLLFQQQQQQQQQNGTKNECDSSPIHDIKVSPPLPPPIRLNDNEVNKSQSHGECGSEQDNNSTLTNGESGNKTTTTALVAQTSADCDNKAVEMRRRQDSGCLKDTLQGDLDILKSIDKLLDCEAQQQPNSDFHAVKEEVKEEPEDVKSPNQKVCQLLLNNNSSEDECYMRINPAPKVIHKPRLSTESLITEARDIISDIIEKHCGPAGEIINLEDIPKPSIRLPEPPTCEIINVEISHSKPEKEREEEEKKEDLRHEFKPPSLLNIPAITLNDDTLNINRGPRAPQLQDGVVTPAFMTELVAFFRAQGRLPIPTAYKILKDCLEFFKRQPSLVDIQLGRNDVINICGDVHGQFFDLANIFDLFGQPSIQNQVRSNNKVLGKMRALRQHKNNSPEASLLFPSIFVIKLFKLGH